MEPDSSLPRSHKPDGSTSPYSPINTNAVLKSTPRSPTRDTRWTSPRTDHEDAEKEQRYSSVSLTSALDRGGWSTQRPGRFTPRKETRNPLQDTGWASGSVHTGAGSLPPPGFDPLTIRPVVTRYNDYVIPAHLYNGTIPSSLQSVFFSAFNFRVHNRLHSTVILLYVRSPSQVERR